jgi:nucleoside-diphosphate-sugar epimerase
MAEARPQAVVVAAATVGGIAANDSRPADFLYDNLAIETAIIHAAHAIGVEKLLFLGSSCIYPREAPQPMPEAALLTGPLEPTNEGTRSPRSPASSSARPTAASMAAISSRRCRPTSTGRATTSTWRPATSCRR